MVLTDNWEKYVQEQQLEHRAAQIWWAPTWTYRDYFQLGDNKKIKSYSIEDLHGLVLNKNMATLAGFSSY
jgi:hypothetical protein